MSRIKEELENTPPEDFSVVAHQNLKAEEQYYEERRKREKRLQIFKDIQSATSDIISAVADGWIDGKDAFAFFSAVEKTIGEGKRSVLDKAIEEVEEPYEAFGLRIESRSGAGRYTYDDASYLSAKAKLKQMETLRKQAYKIREEATIIDPETGEIVPPARYTQGKVALYVTKPKS